LILNSTLFLKEHKVKLFSTKPNFVGYDNSLDAWVPEVWAQETLAILEEQMVIGNLIHRDFSDEISEFGDTVNTRRPNEYVAKRKGANDDVTVQASSADNVAVVLNQHIHTSFTIKDKEESLSFADLIRVHLNPAALSIARKIDRILMGQVYQYFVNRTEGANKTVGQLGGLSTANVKRTMLELGQSFDENKAPVDGRWCIVPPRTKATILELDHFTGANTVGDDGTALRSAALGELLGFNWAMAQNTSSILTATSPAVKADELASDAAAGDTVVTVDAGAEFAVGDYITLEGDLMPYRIIGISTNDLTLNRPLRVAVPASASDIQLTNTGLVDLAGHTGVTAYPANYDKEIQVNGTGVPNVGQLVSFNTAGTPNVALAGEYSIVDVTNISAGVNQIELDRPLETAIADNDVVGYGHAGDYGFGFTRNALAMVMRPLAPPRSGAGALSGTANFNGIAMRVTISYEGRGQGHLVTLDVLFGTKVLDENQAVPFLA
jgi:hypothetical protein